MQIPFLHFLALQSGASSGRSGQQLDPTAARALEFLEATSSITWMLIALSSFGIFILPGKTKFLAAIAAVSLLILPGTQAFLAVLFLTLALIVSLSLCNVPQGATAIAERFGRFHRTLEPGINFIIPVADRLKDFDSSGKLYTFRSSLNSKGYNVVERIPLHEEKYWLSTKEQLLDPESKKVICSDNTEVEIDSIASFIIVDPERAVYSVDRLGDAMLTLLETSLRQEVGRLNADDVVVSRGPIGDGVQAAMSAAAEAWGVRIVRVEIEDITFVDKVREMLSEARESELLGRARIAEAERLRDAEVAGAEGTKQARVLIAQGEFEAQKLQAEGEYLLELKKRQGEAEGLKAISDALRESPDAAVALEALKAQQSVAASLGLGTNTMILPAESAGLFGALGALKQFKSFVGAGDSSSEPE